MNKEERKAVADFIAANEQCSYHEIARLYNLSHTHIAYIAGEFGIRRKNGPKPKVNPVTPATGVR
jgi:hypothetical protein